MNRLRRGIWLFPRRRKNSLNVLCLYTNDNNTVMFTVRFANRIILFTREKKNRRKTKLEIRKRATWNKKWVFNCTVYAWSTLSHSPVYNIITRCGFFSRLFLLSNFLSGRDFLGNRKCDAYGRTHNTHKQNRTQYK